MPGYALHCTVCNTSLGSRAEWLRHLVHDRHQQEQSTSRELTSWSKAERKCALVVYASFQLSAEEPEGGGGLSMLEHFSTQTGGRFFNVVTDFVLIPEQPNVAVVQFESKLAARKVLEKVGGSNNSSLVINGQLVQLRRAENLLDLEWQALLSKVLPANEDDGTRLKDVICSGNTNRKRKLKEDESQQDADVKTPTSKYKTPERNNTGGGGGGGGSAGAGEQVQQSLVGVEESESSLPFGPVAPTSPSDLCSGFKKLLEQVEIPDEQFSGTLTLVDKIGLAISEKFPRSGLHMFRSWYLKLWNPSGTCFVHLFIDTRGILSGNTEGKGKLVFANVFDQVFFTPGTLQKLGLRLKRKSCRTKEVGNASEVRFLHRASASVLRLHQNPWLHPQVQACRLLEYLCSFDPRVKPLLAVIYYWTSVNSIRLRSATMDEIRKSPEPAATEWLLMCFLCQDSVKIVPTPRPREVVSRSQETVVMMGDFDIGLSAEPQFASSWSQSNNIDVPAGGTDKFYLSILKLAADFFAFCASLGSSAGCPVVVNTKDGEVIPTKVLFEKKRPSTRMTDEELLKLPKIQSGDNFQILIKSRSRVSGQIQSSELKILANQIYLKFSDLFD